MRILFIDPKVNNPVRTNLALPLTFLSLYSYVKDKAPFIEFCYHSIEIDHIKEKLNSLSDIYNKYIPDIVITTSITCNFYSATKTLSFFKEKYNCFTILGGLFASSNDKWILDNYSSVDVIVRGEGEETLLELLLSLFYKQNYSNINGTSIKIGNEVLINADRQLINELSRLPILNYKSIPIEVYKKYNSRFYVFASRGCSYNCHFCTLSSHWQIKHRSFPHERVIAEIENIINIFNPKQISFGDDTLCLNATYFEKLCIELSKHRYNVKFGGKIRLDLINRKLFKLMSEAGFIELSFGVESNDSQQLDILNKGSIFRSLNKIDDVLKLSMDYGVRINMNFILGMPGETIDSLCSKTDFIIEKCKHPNVIPLLGFLTPHPGTIVHANLNALKLRVIDSNLENYNHLVPVCVPESLGEMARSLLITSYNKISLETNSQEFNPLLPPKN